MQIFHLCLQMYLFLLYVSIEISEQGTVKFKDFYLSFSSGHWFVSIIFYVTNDLAFDVVCFSCCR
jgi:hypothetical protein